MIATLSTIVFYLGFAVWAFWHFPVALVIAGIGAAILGIFALVGFLKSI